MGKGLIAMVERKAPASDEPDESPDLRQLAVNFTVAVATAGRLAEQLSSTVTDLQEYIDTSATLDLLERRSPASPSYEEKDRRADD